MALKAQDVAEEAAKKALWGGVVGCVDLLLLLGVGLEI